MCFGVRNVILLVRLDFIQRINDENASFFNKLELEQDFEHLQLGLPLADQHVSNSGMFVLVQYSGHYNRTSFQISTLDSLQHLRSL